MTGSLAFWLTASYLLGAVPTSLLAAHLVGGVDLRTVGSKNLGATNLFRVLGGRYAIPVALFDIAKGVIPVLGFAPRTGGDIGTAILLGTAAMVGHVFSVFVRFKGGKGVATGAGALLGLAPLGFLVSLVVWGVTVRLTGYVSLGSILGAMAFPIAVRILYPGAGEVFTFSLVVAGLVIVFHHANIRRLFAGTESRFGQRPVSEAAE